MLRFMRRLIHNAVDLVEVVLNGAGRFVVAQWAQYNSLGQLLFALAIPALAVDAAIAHQYGVSQTQFHGYGFALVAVAFCILPDVAIQASRIGRNGAAAAIWLGCVPLGLVAYQSHIGYSSAVRLGDMQQTEFAHVKLASLRDSENSEKQNLDAMRARLADIVQRNKEARERAAGWVTSTDPTAAQKQLDAMDQKIENEARRVRCAAKCEALKTERANLAAYIANLREEKQLVADIDQKQVVIDNKTRAVASTGYTSSTVVNQTETFAKLYNLAAMRLGWNSLSAEQAIRPTQVQRDVTNTAMAGSASLAFMILAPLLMAAAGVNRLPGSLHTLPDPTRSQEDAPPNVPMARMAAPVAPMAAAATAAPAVTAVEPQPAPTVNNIIHRLDGAYPVFNPVTGQVQLQAIVQAAA